MTQQLPLGLRLRDASSFENFYPGDNAQAVESLRDLLRESPMVKGPRIFYLWGESATGKTHLLEAACRHAQALGATARYLPLSLPELSPAVVEAAERDFLICLDDVQKVAGNASWETALFAIYELACATGARLAVAANSIPAHAGFRMPDLATRLAAGRVYQLHRLSDDAKTDALSLRARNRGFDLPPEAARYIVQRYPRDLRSLFALLDRIDTASLARQRRVTIPFLREIEAAETER